MQINQTDQPTNIPAGWYPDTNAQGVFRYWDGMNWTQHTQASPNSISSQGEVPNRPTQKKSGKKIWVAFLIAPIPLLVCTLILQIIVRFFAQGSGAVVGFVNIISILIGMASILLIIGSPIWIIMLIVGSKKSRNI